MTARCGGRYGSRSTTPGTEITTDGVQAGEILVCELDGDQAHDIHRSGKWWWNTGAVVASDVPPTSGLKISDEAVEAAARAYYEHLGWDWEDLQNATRDHEENLAVIVAEFQIALTAALPHLRVDRDALAKALFVAMQPAHWADFMFAGERIGDAEALADEVIGLMSGTLRTCRVCGCTPYRACYPSGCAWVPGETDLCTSCTTDQGATAPPTSTAGGD